MFKCIFPNRDNHLHKITVVIITIQHIIWSNLPSIAPFCQLIQKCLSYNFLLQDKIHSSRAIVFLKSLNLLSWGGKGTVCLPLSLRLLAITYYCSQKVGMWAVPIHLFHLLLPLIYLGVRNKIIKYFGLSDGLVKIKYPTYKGLKTFSMTRGQAIFWYVFVRSGEFLFTSLYVNYGAMGRWGLTLYAHNGIPSIAKGPQIAWWNKIYHILRIDKHSLKSWRNHKIVL